MNDRIQELALRAEITVTKQCPITEQGYSYYEFSKEKFAQLIVRECLGIYDKIENGNRHLGTDEYPNAVGQHFGLIGRPTVDKTAD